jgi:hypothetical protein
MADTAAKTEADAAGTITVEIPFLPWAVVGIGVLACRCQPAGGTGGTP